MDDTLGLIKTKILYTAADLNVPPTQIGCELLELVIPLLACNYSIPIIQDLFRELINELDNLQNQQDLCKDVKIIKQLYIERATNGKEKHESIA